jgi:predicted acyltransferase
MAIAQTQPVEPVRQAAADRLVSLDAFRGAIIALMVLVNTPGDGRQVYGPLNHAAWHGWTITDVVFPSFVWIVGVAMTFSMARRLAAGTSRAKILAQALRRAAILYGLGLFLYAFPDFNLSTLRLLGVLQRIAICYAAAAAIYLTTGVRGRIVWIAALLGGYWLIMMLAPVPGQGAGYLDVERNFAHYVDSVVLGRHNYAHTRTWDPEGIVSTLPAIATALLGILAGTLLRARRNLAERMIWMFVAGNLLMAAGLICDIWLPINKKIWTSSFALFMAGLDFVMLAICVWWIDGQGHRRAVRPLVIMGMNAITVYMASELIDGALVTFHGHQWIYRRLFEPFAAPMNASLAYAVVYTLSMYALAYVMYRRGWFPRV